MSNNKIWFTALLGLLALSASNAEVINLNTSNFESVIKANDYTLVKMTQDWCGHCRTLAPIFQSASEKLNGKGVLANIDCGADDAKALCEKFQVKGYPTIKGFSKDLTAVDYEDGRSEDAILSHMMAATSPAVTYTTTTDELEAFKKGGQDLKVVINTAADSDLAKTIEGVAKTLRKTAAIAIDTTKTDGKVTLYRTFDEPEVAFTGDVTGPALTQFVSNNSLPIIGEIGPHNYKKYVDRNVPLVWIFIDYTSDEQVAALEQLKPVAKELAAKFGFAKLDGKKWAQHAKSMGLDSSTPGIVIEDRTMRKKFAYPLDSKLVPGDFKAFLDGFQAKTLAPIFKSQPIPEKKDNVFVQTVVGKNYEDVIVNAEGSDSFLMFHAPWCGHCKKLGPVFEQLAESFKDDSNIVIGSIDATENDTTAPFEVTGFPTLYFYPKGDKTKPIRYNGGRDLDSLREFVEKHRKSTPSDDKKGREEL